MRGYVSYGAESSQEGNTAEHGHEVPENHQKKESGIPSVQWVWSLLCIPNMEEEV
jgi:hypothetical protein